MSFECLTTGTPSGGGKIRKANGSRTKSPANSGISEGAKLKLIVGPGAGFKGTVVRLPTEG